MDKRIYCPLSSLFRLCVLIIANFNFSWSEEAVNSTLPCRVTNVTTGAMLCCPSQEANTTQLPDEDEECVEILPLTSAPLLKEFWTIQAFDYERKKRTNVSSPLEPSDGDGTCCCKEKRDFILPGMATTVSGSVTRVLQSSPGYVQPVSVQMCKEASCPRRANGRKSISPCVQHWTATDLYTEHPIHDGFMRKESIKVPSGCSCRIPESDLPSNSKTFRAYNEKEKDPEKHIIEDNIITSIPTVPDVNSSPDTVSRDRYTLNKTNIGPSSQYSNIGYISLPKGDSLNVSSPHTSYSGTREQYLTDDTKRIILPSQNQNAQKNTLSGSSDDRIDMFYDKPFSNAPKFQSPTNPKTSHEYKYTDPGSFEGAPAREGPLHSVGNDPQVAFGHLVPQDRLRALNNLASSPTLQPVNPQLVSTLNDLNSLAATFMKLGLLSPNARSMTTTQIVENALTKVHSSQQMQALAMAERLMLLEIEYLRLSLNMIEMSFRQFDSAASPNIPKFPFTNDLSRDTIPVLFRPGGLSGPLPVVIVEPNKTSSFSGPSSNIQSPQANGSAKPLISGNLPMKGESAMSTQFKEDSSPLKAETSTMKTEMPPKRETPPSKIETPLRKETPPSGESLPRNSSRASLIDDRLEDNAHAAFANYLFQEAWMNSSCMVPLTINESQSELNFLPSLIKEKVDIRVKGRVDISKYAARIISGIIMCRFQNEEAALFDGRLARAITGGIKVAQILNNQIKIMKGLMRGLLDTDDAKALVNILRWTSRTTGSPAAEEFVSSRDAMDIDGLLSVVRDTLKVYVDIFGVRVTMDEKPGVSSGLSFPQSGLSATEANSSIKNPAGPLRNIGFGPQDNGTIGLNSTLVLVPGFNGSRPGMNSTASPLPGTKTTVSPSTGISTTAGVMPVTAGANLVIPGINSSSVARPGLNISADTTSITTSSTVVAAKPVSATTAAAISGIIATAAVVPVINVTTVKGNSTTVPVSSSTAAIQKNDTLFGGSGKVSPATPNPATSLHNRNTPSKPLVTLNEDFDGDAFYRNKSVNGQKPTPYPDAGAETKYVTKNTSLNDQDNWVPSFGDDFEKNPTKREENPNGPKVGDRPGPEDFKGSGKSSALPGTVPLTTVPPKDLDVLKDLPKEYNPLGIPPISLMNLLFPNLV